MAIATGDRPTTGYLDDKGRLTTPTLRRDSKGEPKQAWMPEIKDLVALEDFGLRAILARFGVDKPWEQLVADTTGYVAKMSQIPVTSKRFDEEIKRIIGDMSSKRAMLSLARATMRDFCTQEILANNPNEEMIRVAENDDRTCDACAELGGEMGTYDYHVSIGIPGAPSCYGGDYCRCQLVPIREE